VVHKIFHDARVPQAVAEPQVDAAIAAAAKSAK